jgi:uncharacterized protein YerC
MIDTNKPDNLNDAIYAIYALFGVAKVFSSMAARFFVAQYTKTGNTYKPIDHKI